MDTDQPRGGEPAQHRPAESRPLAEPGHRIGNQERRRARREDSGDRDDGRRRIWPVAIFTFLFGVSFAIFLHTAERRTDRPRLVLLRRLVVLGVLGGLHTFLQPGEVLKFYAGFGLLVLLPASYLPRRWVLWIGIVLTLASALTFRGFTLIPGLFLLGMAATGFGVIKNLSRHGRGLGIAFGVCVLLSAWLGVLQWRAGVGPTAHFRSVLAGLAFAGLYATGFLLLLRTSVRGLLEALSSRRWAGWRSPTTSWPRS
ncbi:hypothetical protein AB0M20_39065 [Actinoplanes sp. NPDC051633]|uniref:hypothetical protein n=1 Tax=Actinoplanes sp. NPDC051633 TaxID=3155670 RepID=UPI00343FA67D